MFIFLVALMLAMHMLVHTKKVGESGPERFYSPPTKSVLNWPSTGSSVAPDEWEYDRQDRVRRAFDDTKLKEAVLSQPGLYKQTLDNYEKVRKGQEQQSQKVDVLDKRVAAGSSELEKFRASSALFTEQSRDFGALRIALQKEAEERSAAIKKRQEDDAQSAAQQARALESIAAQQTQSMELLKRQFAQGFEKHAAEHKQTDLLLLEKQKQIDDVLHAQRQFVDQHQQQHIDEQEESERYWRYDQDLIDHSLDRVEDRLDRQIEAEVSQIRAAAAVQAKQHDLDVQRLHEERLQAEKQLKDDNVLKFGSVHRQIDETDSKIDRYAKEIKHRITQDVDALKTKHDADMDRERATLLHVVGRVNTRFDKVNDQTSAGFDEMFDSISKLKAEAAVHKHDVLPRKHDAIENPPIAKLETEAKTSDEAFHAKLLAEYKAGPHARFLPKESPLNARLEKVWATRPPGKELIRLTGRPGLGYMKAIETGEWMERNYDPK